jgi:lysophospholipid acyltransferase (LPLAT)-like uncharacterized protein
VTDTRGRLDWKRRLATAIGLVAIRVVGVTWRYRVIDYAPIAERRATGASSIFAFWHEFMLPLLYWHRREGVAILISSHRDGEIITRAAHSLGYRSVRGSSSRNAAGGLRGLARWLADGGEVALTPDGPRGPARVFRAGTAIVAQQSGAAVVLIGVAVDRAWRLKSWDRFLIPKPFAKVVTVYDMTFVTSATAREAADAAPELGGRIDALVARAEAALRGG